MFFAVSVGRRLGDFHLIEHNTIYVIKIDRGTGVPRVPGVHRIPGALVCQGLHEVVGVLRILGSVGSPGVSGFQKIQRAQFLHIWIISYNMKFPV